MRKAIYLLSLMVFLAFAVQAQRNVRDSTLSFLIIAPHGGFQLPFADMADRFGYGGIIGAELMWKMKSNYTIEAQYGYIFGNEVKEDTILKPLLNSQNFIINREGEVADVFLQQRGFLAYAKVGKIFSVVGPNVNSGLHVAIGTGFIQHRIRIQESSQKVPQLSEDYIKGYDRLSNGWMVTQSIGYSHFSDFRLINYYIGVEFYEGWTQNRRTVNYDTGLPDRSTRFDVIGSIVIRWYFPLYRRQPQDFYFY